MSDPEILDRIDDTLDEWDSWDGHSSDAARWSDGEWVEARRPEHRDLSYPGERRLWMVEPSDPDAPSMAELDNALDLTPYLRVLDNTALFTFDLNTGPFAEAMRLIAEATIQLGRECWKCRRWHYGEGMRCDTCWPKQLPRPMASAERTRSPRWRAGTRRAKRQARTNRKGTRS